jgi:excisionase family DNA binding protein
MRELFTFDELKKYLKINRSTLYKFVQEGKIPATKIGRQWRFDLKEIDDWIKKQSAGYRTDEHRRQAEKYNNKIDNTATKTALEKRRFFRLTKSLPVRYNLLEKPVQRFNATGKNISVGGIFMEIEDFGHKLLSLLRTKKRRMKLVIELSELQKAVEVQSEIAWFCEEPLFRHKIGVGLKFTNLTPKVTSRISSFIVRHSSFSNGAPRLPVTLPIRLESSIVVKRKREEVFNLLRDIERFPEFIRSINSVNIVGQVQERIISEWSVEIDDLPIRWRQLDILEEDKGSINFRLLEGDFDEYKGRWSLQQLLTGTEIKLTMIVDFGMSNLTRYTEPFLKQKLENFIQEILIDIRNKLWVEKTFKLVKFACVIHPLDIPLFCTFEPGAREKSYNLLKKSFELTPPFHFSNITGIRSLTGKKIDGELILCPLLPEQMLNFSNDFVLKKIIAAGKLAEQRGVKIFGLAAYTAGVGKKGILVERALNIPVTTGTNYTIVVTIDGLLEAAKKVGIDLSSADVAIVGATGSIGRICAQILSEEACHLSLIARNEVRLNELASILQASSKARLNISTEINKIVSQSDIIVAATNSPYNLIDADLLRPGTLVCDISLPKNVSAEDALRRKDILVIDGGLVKPPGDVDFHYYYGLPPGLTYACMAETMILALEEKFESYSLGGNVSLDKVKEIGRLGKKHGFKLATLRSFGKGVSEEKIEKVHNAYVNRRRIKR